MTSHAFDLLMELDTTDIRLDCAALHLARDAYPYLHIHEYTEKLDALAGQVAELRPGISAVRRYHAMREVLVGEFDLRGDGEAYYDPESNYLNRVIDRRRGIPISLSIVWIEVGRRLKWPVAGVAFPGHFLVRFDDPQQFVLADPFHDGQALSVDECRHMLKTQFVGEVPFTDDFLKPADTRSILTRMLNNLRLAYLFNADWQKLGPVLRHLVSVERENGRHLQELAALDYYLDRLPNGADCVLVRRHFKCLATAMAYRN
ncbi:MAG: transglutaminase family protein [Planctomycetes bacterium]|nr:transglutaminase family protein [Planctomycetota bacterium]